MKKTTRTPIFLLLMAASMGNGNLSGQTPQSNTWTKEKAIQWFNTGEWKNGLSLNVYEYIDLQEFAKQYHNNKTLWDKAFAYLKNTNLDTIAPGKYTLVGDDLYVSITEGFSKPFEETKWEAHKKYIDIQHVIKGKEKMGVAPFSKTSVLEVFNDTKDVGFYTVPEGDGKYYEATPRNFLIFFPCEAHRPSIRIEGNDIVKKIVIKVKAD
jgi:biofilm protein TabA